MNRPSLKDVTQHYLDIYDCVKSYVNNHDEVLSLTNQIYHLSSKNAKKAFTAGLLIGGFAALIALKWVS